MVVPKTQVRDLFSKTVILAPDEKVVMVKNGVVNEVIDRENLQVDSFLNPGSIGKDVDVAFMDISPKDLQWEQTELWTRDNQKVSCNGLLRFRIQDLKRFFQMLYCDSIPDKKGVRALSVQDIYQRLESEVLTLVLEPEIRKEDIEKIYGNRYLRLHTENELEMRLKSTLSMWGLEMLTYTVQWDLGSYEKVMQATNDFQTKEELAEFDTLATEGYSERRGREKVAEMRAGHATISTERDFQLNQKVGDVKSELERLEHESDMRQAREAISLLEELKLAKARGMRAELEVEQDMKDRKCGYFYRTQERSAFFKKQSPLEQINADELFAEKIRLEREEELKTAEVEKLAEKKKELFQKGFNATKAEQRSLARKIKETDRDVKLKEKHLQTMNKQILAVNNMQFIHEQKKLLKSSGVMSKLTNLPPTELNKFLSEINLQTKISENGIDIINDMFTAEFDLDGEMDEDSETQNLMNVWDSATEEEVDEVYSEWESKLESGGISNNSNRRLRSCTITGNEKNSKISDEETDCVSFTLTAPSTMAPGNDYELGVWAYLKEQEQEMIEAAMEMHETDDISKKSKKSVPIERKTRVTVRIDMPNFEIEDPQDTIYWDGEVANATFMVEVPENLPFGKYRGKLFFLVEELEIAKLDFKLTVGNEEKTVSNIPANLSILNSAFISYASEDSDEVFARVQVLKEPIPGLKVELFVDKISLNSGEDWYDIIIQEIKERDIMYLFWSEAASKSKWVEKEWKFALESKGIEFIKPIPLVSPDKIPPPKELESLHFYDWTLAFMKKN